MQGIITSRRETAVNLDELLNLGHFGAQDDLVVTQSAAFGKLGRFQGADYYGFVHHLASILRLRAHGILVHHPREQTLIKRAPVNAYSNGLLILNRNFDHLLKILVVMLPGPDIAGVDSVFGQRSRALRIFLEQYVTVIMKITDDRNAHSTIG